VHQITVLTIGERVTIWRVRLRHRTERQTNSQVFQSPNLLQPKSKRTNGVQSDKKNDTNRTRLVIYNQSQEITNKENQKTDQGGPGSFAEQGRKEKRKANNCKERELPKDEK
jgi:hypothetical protein